MWRYGGLFVGILLALPAAGEMYKWEDDDGNVHYGDSLPPEVARERREAEVKSEQGTTQKVIEPPPTAEELERRRQERLEAKRERERERQRREEQAAQDKRLHRMYSGVEQIRKARDERLEAVQGRISVRKRRIERLKSRLEQRREEAARLERSDRGDPESVYKVIDRLERSVAEHESVIEDHRQQKQRLKQRFARDMERFRELTEDSQADNR